jgi:rusticyanin
MMIRKQMGVLVSAAVVATVGLGAGIAVAAGSPARTTAASSTAGSPAYTADRTGYSWYRSMMGRYYGSGTMMGGRSWQAMMGATGYRWMTGGADAPGWMRGGSLPGAMTGMMGTGTDPGKIMGRLWASAPGPRVSPAEAAQIGTQIPAGGHVNRAIRAITFTTTSVHLAALASPAGGPDETFRIAGLVNPTIIVPAGSHVSIEMINADNDTAHGLVITASGATSSRMPMMTGPAAFAGSALWFLGNPTATGMHAGTLRFTATTPGTYHYLCPVPGHAQKGMTGTFTVSATG